MGRQTLKLFLIVLFLSTITVNSKRVSTTITSTDFFCQTDKLNCPTFPPSNDKDGKRHEKRDKTITCTYVKCLGSDGT
ncbi:hypothetical protein Glove_362g82 [Diversispora epigaea]|uniref:Uncharacterized protein n=1 Tax=Diversispora epigaea TaxID=1348612 RepID=A0A397H9P0_9GLOM|nr:hypothetical protein Glove_362g82 [Diversispora epigaea]